MSESQVLPDSGPTQKMVDEAINWTGPWLGLQQSGQLRMYVATLRKFAMASAMHPDYLAPLIGNSDE